MKINAFTMGMPKAFPIRKILLIMKLTTLLMIAIFVHASAAGFSQRISLNEKSANLETVLKSIKRQSGYVFFYDEYDLKNKKITIAIKNATIDEALTECFKSLPLTFNIISNTVILKKKNMLSAEQAEMKAIELKGKVVDEGGGPLPGASLKLKGSDKGTTTDSNGSFSITVPDESAILIVSFIGYETTEVKVLKQRQLTITLKPANADLSEIVVVGYGTQKKVNLTGAIASVNSEKLESRPLTNLGQGLQGLIPNLNINRGTGAPGSGAVFNIRGATSINNDDVKSSSPLILVDGVQMDPNLINPEDVESVTVLKDAASAAIYGVRGAFGVILITTKNPKKNGPARISYSGSLSNTRPTRLADFLASTDYIRMHREANSMASTGSGSASEPYSVMDSIMAAAFLRDPVNNPSVYVANPSDSKYRYVGNTNWVEELYPGWAPINQHSLSISGSEGKIAYLASLGYFNQKGLLKVAKENYNRYNPTIKLNSEVNSWLDLNVKATLNRTENNKPTTASHGGTSSSWLSTDLRPTMPVYHPDGHFSGQGNYTNPIALATLNGRTIDKQNDLFLTGGAVIKPIKDIKIITDYTWNSTSALSQRHAKAYNEYGVNGVFTNVFPWSSPSRLTEGTFSKNYYVFNAYADYEHTFATKHYVKATMGYNQEQNQEKFYSASVKNLIDQDKPAINLNSDTAPIVTGYENQWALTGTFFRVNYIFDNKYLLEVNGRYDGTSRYKRGNRYTFNPSVSAGWRISEEGFFGSLKKTFNDVKIRASYGTLPNQGNSSSTNLNFRNYPYIPTMSSGNLAYILGGAQAIGVNPPGLVSEDFTWEKVTTKDIGLDISMLNYRLTATFDAYVRDTKDMLSPGLALPAVLGTGVPQVNSADLSTKGWELSLEWRDKIGENWTYNVGVNASDWTAEITRFGNNPNKLLNNNYVGRKVGEIWGFETEGFFQTDAAAAAADQKAIWGGTLKAGDIKYKDLNGDGKITRGSETVGDPGDMKVIGNNTPRYQFGINLGATYKGFDFNAFLQGVGKRDYVLGGTYFFPFAGGEYDVPLKHQLDYWTPETPNAYYPRMRFGGGGNFQTQTKYLQNAAYLRMKNITLGYSLPVSLISKVKMTKARIYIGGENLFEFTKVNKAFDPELLGAQDYPLNRAIILGVQIGL